MMISNLHPSGSAATANSLAAAEQFLHLVDLVISLIIVVVILLTRTG